MKRMQLFGFTCGTVTLKKRSLIDDGTGMIELPITAYLITHPEGNVLFDTGPHAELADPSSGRLGELAKYMTLSFRAEDHIVSRLAQVGYRPSDISVIVNSHLHYDHAGGNSAFPRAKVFVQRPEWNAANQPDLIKRNGYNPSDYISQDPENVVCVDGELDLFGDRSIVLMPTYGHTPGHQCLVVRIGGRVIILSGDACYLNENMERCMVSRLSFNVGQARDSLERLAALRRDRAELIIGHDPDQWREIPKAPLPIASTD